MRETPLAKFERQENAIRNSRRPTPVTSQMMAEIKANGTWRLKYYSWGECCKMGFKYSSHWVNQLIATQKTIKEIMDSDCITGAKDGVV